MANLSKKTCLLISFFIFVLFVFISPTSFAITQEECEKKIGKEKLSLDELKECEGIFNDLQQKSKAQQETLSAAISYFENKIRLTTTLIAQNEEKLKVLEREIENLNLKIGRLDESLETISQLLVFRIIETYKKAAVNPAYLFLSSDGFSQFLTRYNYLKIVQAHDRQLLFKMEQARFDYDAQRVLKEEKQKEVEAVKSLLEKQKLALAQQKKDKVYLLEVTKNDEKRYQELLARARAEVEAILAILAGKGKEEEVGHVSEGQKMASIIDGSSCNSSGTHLHFMVTKGDVVQNPFNYLKGDVSYENCSGYQCGDGSGDLFDPHGDWNWPIDSPIKLTQGYGYTWAVEHHTWVRNIYNFHNGIDIKGSSLEVKAVKQGILYQGVYTTKEGCGLSYVRVKHDESDFESYYLHVY